MTQFELVVEEAQRPRWLRHQYWHLLRSMTAQMLSVRYRQSILTLTWMVVQPVAAVAIYAVFFNGILDVDGDGLPYLAFIVVGLVPWRFFSSALSQSSVLGDNAYVMTKIYFPRELVPLSLVSSGLIELAVGTVTLLILAAVQGYPPTIHLIALIPIYGLIVLVTAWVTILLATLAVFVRDLNHGMPMFLQLLFFSTPIMYPISRLPWFLEWLSSVNPLAVAIISMRQVVFERRWPEWFPLGTHLVLAGLSLVLAIGYVRSVEHRMVDIV